LAIRGTFFPAVDSIKQRIVDAQPNRKIPLTAPNPNPRPNLDHYAASSDEEIVTRVLGGEIELFELIMRRHNQRVFRAVRAILKSDDEAEDVMQEAYVSAYTHLATFAGRAQLSTWLVRIAVNEAFARLRRHKKVADWNESEAEVFDMPTQTRGPEETASDHELRGILESVVDTLPESFRTVFVLRAVEQLSVSETAEVLGIPEDTVKTRLHRARGLLQNTLEGRVGGTLPSLFDFHLSRCDRVVNGVLSRVRRATT
jgi:RNA polymerase sigma-70 factor (ECF subfamily)